MTDTTELTAHQKAMVETWTKHGRAEFEFHDPDGAINTMGSNPYILAVPLGQLFVGRQAVHSFYKYDFLCNIPKDADMTPVRRIVGADHIADEFIMRFTHTVEMPWQVPGVAPTGRKAEILLMVFAGFEGDKIAYEHLMWDHATLLTQLGVLNHPAAAGGLTSTAQYQKLVAERNQRPA